MAFQKKTSPTVETVVGQAAISLKKSLDEFKVGLSSLEALNSKMEDLGLQIVAKEERIKELDVTFQEKLRAHNVEFDLKVKENSLKVVQETLTQHHLVTIPEQELKELEESLKESKDSLDKRVKDEVTAATGALHGTFSNKEKLLEANFKAQEAENVARINSLTAEVVNLKAQVEDWKGQLVAERTASVQRAQHGAIHSINVGGQDSATRR